MSVTRFHGLVVGATLVVGLVVAGYFTRSHWIVWLKPEESEEKGQEIRAPTVEKPRMLEVSAQARKNLQLVARPVQLQTYWRTIQVPGMIVDRPGQSDRGVTAPAVGVVSRIHAFPGDTVRPGDRLFTLRLISEYLQNTQSELFKTSREMQLVKEQRDRLAGPAKSGAIPDTKFIEVENQLRRLTAALQAYRQDLLTRGLTPSQVEGVAEGKFVAEIEVVAPRPSPNAAELISAAPANAPVADHALAYEVQELKAELGQQVQAGQTLCLLANHQTLYIEGRGFKRESPLLEQAAQNGWPVRVEFSEDNASLWPPLEQTFAIRHLANSIDPGSRTFAFFLPLTNQSRAYQKDGRTFLVWRFRPGQRVRLHVPVEELREVFVLPVGAVARAGPEAYVFRQNGDLFDRWPVHILHEDRLNTVLANDGSITPGMYLAQSAAASLNRVLKAQNASGGLPPGAHFHADGSLHIPGQ